MTWPSIACGKANTLLTQVFKGPDEQWSGDSVLALLNGLQDAKRMIVLFVQAGGRFFEPI